MAINFNDVVDSTASLFNKNTHNNFINDGGRYQIITDGNSYYLPGEVINGQIKAGVIFINVNQVVGRAREGISSTQAIAEVVTHELGHFFNRASDGFANARTEAQKANWFYEREGKAAFYAFKVASEANANGKIMGVGGVTGEANLYNSMLAHSLSLGLNPLSNAYERAMIQYVTKKFANDPQYQKAMQEFLDSSPSPTPGDGSYIPPSSGGDGGGGFGGGGSGPIGTVTPINLPPPEPPYTFNPSSLPNYTDSLYNAEISLVGISVSSNQVLI